jgi:hypothetical protein
VQQQRRIAWDTYEESRKGAANRWGPESKDPRYDLPVEWLDARAAPNADVKTRLSIRPLSGVKQTCCRHARIFRI